MRPGSKVGGFWGSLGWAAVFSVALAVVARPAEEPAAEAYEQAAPEQRKPRGRSAVRAWTLRVFVAFGLLVALVAGLGARYAQVRPPLVELRSVSPDILESWGVHLYRPPALYEPMITVDQASSWDNPEYERATPVKEVALARVEIERSNGFRCLCWVMVLDEVPASPTGDVPKKEDIWWIAFVDAETGEFLLDAVADIRVLQLD